MDNTDAEGRLILVDAIWYAQQTCKPRALLDMATLTGTRRPRSLTRPRLGLTGAIGTDEQRLYVRDRCVLLFAYWNADRYNAVFLGAGSREVPMLELQVSYCGDVFSF